MSPFSVLTRYRSPTPATSDLPAHTAQTLHTLHRLQARAPGPWFMREMLPALHHDLGLAPDVGRVHIRALISMGYLKPVPAPRRPASRPDTLHHVPRPGRRYAWVLANPA